MALRADWQRQLQRCHDELGIRHVRFHGLLSDDLGTFTVQNKKPLYSFFNADQIFSISSFAQDECGGIRGNVADRRPRRIRRRARDLARNGRGGQRRDDFHGRDFEAARRRLARFQQHVAHVIVDGLIGARGSAETESSEPALDPDRMAEAYFQLVEQDRSAWTLELDLRPHREKFFE